MSDRREVYKPYYYVSLNDFVFLNYLFTYSDAILCTGSYGYTLYRQLRLYFVQAVMAILCTGSYGYTLYRQLRLYFVQAVTAILCTGSYGYTLYRQLWLYFVQAVIAMVNSLQYFQGVRCSSVVELPLIV